MYIRQPGTVEQSQNKLGRTLLGLIVGIIGTLSIYAFYNLSLGFPSYSSKYDTGVNSGDVPSVGDYLFGSGEGSGSVLSGELLSGNIDTGNNIVYPTGYMDEFNKALLILKNDSNVNTYIDTDNLISSGFDSISVQKTADKTVDIWLNGSITPTIEKLFIIGANKNGAYHFDTITPQGSLFQYHIDANSGTLKPGLNTYYLIGKTTENTYTLQYIKIHVAEGQDFFKLLSSFCLLDICSDPKREKSFISGSNTILQQSPDGKTVIQIIPDSSITIAYKEGATTEPTIRKIKKIGNYYQKTLISGGEKNITQKFIDKDGNPVDSSTAGIIIPSKLSFGNIKYNNPKIQINNSTLHFNKVAKIDASLIIEDIKKNLKLIPEYGFQLADGTYVIYSLDMSSLKVVNPTHSDGTFKVIPKVANRMTNAIVYTVPSSEIGMHDTITSYFKGVVIEKTATCSEKKPNNDSNAKFGLYPIDGQYDVVGLWNCYGIK